MYTDFFQIQSLPTDRLVGTYDLRLVVLSFMVAIFASYIALDLTGRLRDKNNTKTKGLLWLIGGAIAMGSGIWSMHFIGMLSFTIPGLLLEYDLLWTLFSLLVAIIGSGFALFLLKKSIINIIHLIAGGLILGLAIASMHYTGMAALLISLNIRYLPELFFLSILIAIIASEAAIWFALKSNTVILRLRSRVKLVSAIIMGIAICGMHYTGMAASVFTPLCTVVSSGIKQMDPTVLAMSIASITFIILGIAFFASSYTEASNLQKFEQARALGMAEISASVLHSVGNVLNSVNISAAAITEKVTASELSGLEKISTLLSEHKSDLGEFVTKNERGIHTLDFINKLAEYWQKEKAWLHTELAYLTKNLMLIKDIISTQQNLSMKSGVEQNISIRDLMDEALLIVGFDKISVEKHYAKIGVVITDRVQLLQIIVNILYNAKDALLESTHPHKVLIIKSIIKNKSEISIHISDNGVGIAPENLNIIFNFGFTTKSHGHGFGLHNSALAINELGGSIQVQSGGLGEGALFILDIPYKKPNIIK